MATIIYFIKETFRSLWQAKLLTFVSIVTVGITLFFITLLTLLWLNIHHWVDNQSNESPLSIYLDISLSEREEQRVFSTIGESPSIDSLHFVSREEAHTRFLTLYGTELLKEIKTNPFPASVEIISIPPSIDVKKLAVQLQKIDGVESVVYAEKWLKKLTQFQQTMRTIIIAITAIIITALFFAFTNTIRLTVYAREELIGNMQFVGAPYWYIQTPFILEGVMQGVIGSLFAFFGVTALQFFITHYFSGYTFYWGDNILFILMVTTGTLLGAFGGASAVRKFIR